MNKLWYFGIGAAYLVASILLWKKRDSLVKVKNKSDQLFCMKTDIAIAVLLEIWAGLKFTGTEGTWLLVVDALLLTVPIFSVSEIYRARKENKIFKEGV